MQHYRELREKIEHQQKDYHAKRVRSYSGIIYSGTSDKGPSEIGTTSLQRTLVATPC